MANPLLDRLDRALAANHPDVRRALGGRPERSDLRRLEIHEDTPPRFHALYARWDGGGRLYGDHRFLTLRQMDARRVLQFALFKRSADWKQKGWWHQRWYPFLRSEDGAGYLVLDLSPGAFGQPPGRILSWDPKRGPSVAFEGIEAFLETLCVQAEHGVLVDHDAAAQKLYQQQNPGFPHRGNGRAKPLHDEFIELSSAGDFKRLLARTGAELKRDPAFLDAWVQRAAGLEQLDRTEEAMAAHQQILKLAPDLRESLLRLAQLRLGEASLYGRDDVRMPKGPIDFAAAERELDAFMASEPWDWEEKDAVDAYAQLAAAHETAGHVGELFRVFDKWKALARRVDKRDPTRFHFHVWYDYSTHLKGAARKKALQTALAGTQARIQATPGGTYTAQLVAQLHYYAARFAGRLGLFTEAIAHLRAARRFNPKYLQLLQADADLAPLFADAAFQKAFPKPAKKKAAKSARKK